MIENTVGGLKRLRHSRLLAGCAAAALAGPSPLIAANLPTGGDVVSGVVKATAGFSGTSNGVGVANPIISDPTKTALDLQVTGSKAIINWTEFNIDAGNVVTFNNAAAVPYSVLNRVTTPGAPSIIGGTLKGGTTGSATIWLINEAGITLQGSGVVSNVSGFVASSLNVVDSNFLDVAGTPLKFSSPTSQGAITLATGSTITTSGPVLLVAPSISAGGTITATGDVGVVVAADATVQLQGNSIISVKIDSGTTIDNANLTVAAGATVTGDHVYALAVSNATVINTLLQINGNLNATMATAGPQGIVLSAGRDATNVVVAGTSKAGDVVLTGGLIATGGNVEIGSTGNITANVTAPLTLTSVDAAGDVKLTGAGALTLGSVVAGGDYAATGTSLTLGAASAVRAQTAHGSVTLKSTTGNIDALGTLTITSSDTGLGGSLILDSFGNITGAAALAGGTLGHESDIGIHAGALTSVSLGDVTGRALGNIGYVGGNPVNGYAPVGPALSVAGSVNLGAVTVRGTGLSLESTGSTLDAVNATSTTGSVTLASFGALTLGSGSSAAGSDYIVGTAGSLAPASVTGTINSGQDLTVTGSSVTAAGSLTATRDIVLTGSSVTLGEALQTRTISAGNDVVVRSTVGDIASAGTVTLTSNSDDNVAGGRILLDSAGNITASAAKLVAGGATNGTDVGIRLTALTNTVSLGNITAHQLGNVDYVTVNTPSSGYGAVGGTLATQGAITLGDVTTHNALTIVSNRGGTTTGINVSAGDLESTTGAVDVSALSGTLSLTGAKSPTSITLTSAQSLTATAGLIDSGGSVTVVSTLGNATLGATTAPGSITVTSASGGGFTATLGTALGTNSAGGDITLTGGNVVVQGSTSAGDDIVLNAQAGTVLANSLTTTGLGSDNESGTGLLGGSNISVLATSDASITGTSSSKRDFTATSTGGKTTLAIGSAGRDLTLTGNDAEVTTSASAGDDVVLNATAGSVVATSLSTSGIGSDTEGGLGSLGGSNILVTGTGNVTIKGTSTSKRDLVATSTGGTTTLTAGSAVRDIVLTGSSVTLGEASQTRTISAGNDVVVRSTVGDIASAGTVTLTSNSDDNVAGGRILLDSAGNITASGAKLVAGGATNGTDVGIRLNALTNSVSLGNITAHQLGNVDYVTANTPSSGYGAVGGTLATQGAITLGDVTTHNALTIVSNRGGTTTGINVSAGDLESTTGAVDVSALSGTLSLTGAKSPTSITLTSAQSLTATAGLIDSGGSVTVVSTLGNATLGATTAPGSITVTSASGGGFTATLGTALGTNSAGGDITLTGGNVVVQGSTSAGDDIVLNAQAGTVLANSLTTTGAGTDNEVGGGLLGGSNISILATSDATITGTSSSKRDFTATSTGGKTTLAIGSAGRDLTLTGNDVVVTTSAAAGDDVVLNALAGTVLASGLTATGLGLDSEGGNEATTTAGLAGLAGSNVSVQASGDASVNGSSASARDLTVRSLGGNASVAIVTGARDIRVVAAPAAAFTATLGTVQATRDITASGGNIGVTTSAMAGDDIVLVASNGNVLANSLSTTGTGVGSEADELTPTLGVFGLNGSNIVLQATGTATLGGVSSSARDLVIASSANGVEAGTVTAGRDLVMVAANGFAAKLADGTAARDITISGGSVDVTTSATAGDDIVLVASNGSINANALSKGAVLGPDSEAGNEATPTLGLSGLAGSNIVATASGSVTLTGTPVSARDLRLTSGGTTSLATGVAARDITLSGLNVVVGGAATAGDDIVLVASSGTVVANGLSTTGAGPDSEANSEALQTLGLQTLAKSNISVLASGNVTLTGAVSSSRDLVARSSGGTVNLASGTALRDLTLSGKDVIVGTSASAGDDLVLVASTGTVLATGLTATGLGSDSETGSDVTPTAGVTGLAGSNIAVLAAGNVTISGTSNSARDLLVTSGANAGVATAIAGRDIRITSAPGSAFAASLTNGTAGRDVTLTGSSVGVGTAKAGDDIRLIALNGNVDAADLQTTGAGTDNEPGDPTLGGANVIVDASGTATVTGVVASSSDYRVTGGNVVLGSSGTTLTQNANGRVIITSTTGSIAFPGLNGTLRSNAGHTSVGTAGGLSLSAATSVTGATTNIEAATATGLNQASQPFALIVAAANGGGSVSLAKVSGGAVAIAAPNTISVPLVVASGDVEIAGIATSGNDVATIDPLLVTIDHAGVAGPVVPANIYIAGGHGASATVAVANGGHVGTLQISSDTGTAALLGTPATTADIDSILVESQHGLATIADAQGGTIAIRGRQIGSSATITGTATAAAGISLVGPTVVVNHAVTGTGDVQLAATGDATLTLGNSGRNISVSAGGVASIDTATASGRVNVSGGTVNILSGINAGDDLILTGGNGGVTATTATLHAGGGTDLQAGDDSQNILVATTTSVVGSGYAGGGQVLELGSVVATSSVTGAALSQLGGSNIVLSARDVTTGGAVTATRDIRYEAARNISFATANADRDLIAAAGQTEAGNLTVGTSATAGDDLVLVSSDGSVLAGAATLTAAGGGVDGEAGNDLLAIKRADGSALADPTGTGSVTRLAGANIVVAASDAATVLSATTAGQGRDIRIAANGVSTLATATARRDLLVLGGTVSTTGAITAGDDIAVVARSGNATVATATTTGAVASNETLATDTLVDLSGNALGLPGEAPLVRLDRSSIVIATVNLASVEGAVSSAGRYTVIGRGGVSLGGAGTVVQTAAGDVLIAASLGASVPDRDVTLLNTLSLRSNEDGLGAGDGIRFLLGSGSINGAAATLTVGRSAAQSLADQGVLSTVLLPGDAPQTNNIKGITLAVADAPWIDLRATGNVQVTDAVFDGGLTLASSGGSVALSTATVANGVPLITASEAAAIDLRLFGTTGATLGSTANASDGKLRDVTVATTGGTASVTRAAARDDIVVASTNGAANAQTLILTGTASDSELGNAGATLADANGAALADPYQLTGPAIASLQGSNIVVSGGTGATLVSGTAAGTAHDVRVQTLNGAALLTTGLAPSAQIFVGSRNGSATATSATANDITLQGATALLTLGSAGRDVSISSSAGAATIASATAGRDLFIAANGGPATLTLGTAVRDITITGPSVVIGTATAGDDIVAVASGGTLVGTTLTSTGLGPDSEADDTVAAKAADGSTILDPTLVAATPIDGLTGSNVVALATSDVTLNTVAAAGSVRLGSLTGTATAINTTSTSGDLIITAAIIDATALTAGRDIKLRSTVGSTTATTLDAVRDLKIDAKTDAVVRNTAVAGNSVAINALQGISIGSLAPVNTTVLTTTAGSAALHAGGDIVVFGLAKTGTAFSADAGTVTLASLDAGTTADLTGATDVTVTGTAKSGGDFTATATGGTLQLASLDSGAGAVLTALHGVGVTGLAKTSGSFKATGGTITLGSLDAGTTVDLLAATDVTILGTAKSGGNFNATATGGALKLASLDGGANATLKAAGNVGVTGLAKTIGSFTANGGTIALGSLNAGTTADLTATGDATISGTAVSGGNFDATSTGGKLLFASLDSGANATLAAANDIGVTGSAKTAGSFKATGGTITLGSLDAGTTAVLTSAGDTAISGTAVSGGDFTATSTAGSLQLASLDSKAGALLTAQHNVGITGLAKTLGSFKATGGTITLGSLDAGTTAELTSVGDTAISGTAISGGDFNATSTAGNLQLASLASGGAATLTAAQNIGVTGIAKSAGAFTANGGTIALGSLDAGTTAALTAASDVTVIGTSVSGQGFTGTATSGNLTLASLDTGGDATLTAGQTIGIAGLAKSTGAFSATGGAIALGTLTAGTTAQLIATNAVAVAGTASSGGNFTAKSTNGSLGFATLTSGGTAVLDAGTGIAVTGVASSAGDFGATAGAGIALGTLTSGGQLALLSANDTVVTNQAKSTGALTATSTAGGLHFGSIDAGAAVQLTAGTGIVVDGAAKSAGALVAKANGGAASFGSLASGGLTTLTASGNIGVTGAATSVGVLTATSGGGIAIGSLDAGAAATLLAANDVAITGLAKSGAAFDARSTTGSIQLGSLSGGGAATLIAARNIRVLGAATATGGLTATAGQALRLGSLAAQSAALVAGTDLMIDGAAVTSGTLQAAATTGAVTIDSLSAGATTLTAATNLQVTNLAKSTSVLTAKATAGSVQFGSLDAASATLTAQQNLNVAGVAKTGTTLTATATGGDLTIGSLDAGSDAILTATAGNLKLGTGLAGAVQPTARTTGKLTLLATAGTATVNGGVAAGSDYTITAGKLITLAADGATQSSATKVTLNAPDLSLSNTMTLKAADRVQLNVTGTATRVAIGDGLTAATATTYALSNTELGRISAPKFEIDADNGLATTASRTVDIGRATIADPVTTFALKARGDITLTDLLEFKTATGATARTMTLGGSLDGGPLDKTVATNPGAASIRVLTRLGLDNAAGGTGGQISAAGSTVALRANYIVLGDRPTAPDVGQPFVDALLPPVGGTAADLPRTIEYVRSNFFANASSTLYRALPGYTNQSPTPQAIVTAGTLILAPTQFALIQNTGASSQVAGGIDLTTLKLIKLGTVDPIIAVFGELDGQNGVVASVRISADALDGISPNNVRINGCIALQSASCILTGVSLPIIKLVDPGDALLVSNNAGLALPIDLVTGASNELLWRDDDDDDETRRKADPDSAPVSTTGAAAPADVARPSEIK